LRPIFQLVTATVPVDPYVRTGSAHRHRGERAIVAHPDNSSVAADDEENLNA
jgi:hypothetical protein